MTLESFKAIHRDDSPEKKLELLFDTFSIYKKDAVNCADAGWRRNEKEAEYWRNEERHMYYRAYWLYCELIDVLKNKG